MAPEAGSARSSGGGAAAPALPPPGDGAFCAFDDLHVRHSRCGGAVPHNTMQEVPLDTGAAGGAAWDLRFTLITSRGARAARVATMARAAPAAAHM